MLLLSLFVLVFIWLKVFHEKKRRYFEEKHKLLSMLEILMGFSILLGLSWLLLSTGEALIQFGNLFEGGSLDQLLFSTGSNYGESLVVKDILEIVGTEVSLLATGNFMD